MTLIRTPGISSGAGSGLPAGGVTGQVPVKTDDGAAWMSVGRPFKSGWYYPNHGSGPTRNMTVVGQSYTLPFDVETPTSFSGAAINVTTAGAAGAVFRAAVYASGSDGMPGDLMLDLGTVDISTTGVKTWTFGTPLTVQPDRLWLTGCWQGTATTVPVVTGFSGLAPGLGWSSVHTGAAVGYYYAGVNLITGSFPVNLPTPNGVEAGSCARIQLRVA